MDTYQEAELSETAMGIGRACLRWAGLLDDEGRPATSATRIETFADVIQHSSIPEACATVAENIADDELPSAEELGGEPTSGGTLFSDRLVADAACERLNRRPGESWHVSSVGTGYVVVSS